MAIRTTYKYKCDLDKGTLETTLRNSLMQADALADAFAVTVQRNGTDVDISGMTVYGYLYANATKTTVPLKGTISGSTATVILSEDCYAVPGYASLMIQLHDGDVRHTVLKVDFAVARAGGTLVLDGDNILPTLAELLGQIAAMEQATVAAREATAVANQAVENVEAFKGEIQGDITALSQDIDDYLLSDQTVEENLYDSSTLVSGKYVNYQTGNTPDHPNFSASDYIKINSEDVFEIVGNGDVQCATYDAEKVFVVGYEKASYFNTASVKHELPANVAYLRISVLIGQENQMQVIRHCTQKNYNEKLLAEIRKSKTVVVTVGENGCDYNNLRTCLENIQPTKDTPYKVLLSPGTYDIKSYYTEEEARGATFKGLFIPDYTELVGLGGKENTLLVWDNTDKEKNSAISPLNIRNVATLRGLTVKGVRVRYAVHDDFATQGEDNIRLCVNCEFIAIDGAMSHCYGSGHKGRANWHYKNCIFNCPTTMYAFLNHNNINVADYSIITFDNCRFLSDVILASMTNGTTAFTDVVFKGCNCRNGIGKIEMVENSAATYGQGICFKVSGYGNNFDNSKVVFKNSDGVDYTGYADLI